jgi:hypothetical protein
VWPVVILLLLLGGMAGAMVVSRMNAKKSTDSLTAAPPAAGAPVAVAPNTDSIAALQKIEADSNAKLEQEIADMRKAAMTAEHKSELQKQAQAARIAAASVPKGETPPPPPPEPPHAHIMVIVRGGTPAVLIDGQQTTNHAPALVEVPPGKHVVSVRGAGGNRFEPSEYSVDLAAGDTQQVNFVSQRVAENQALRQAAARSPAASGAPAAVNGAPAATTNGAGGAGSAAATTDSAGLTAAQRQKYKMLDSIRKARKPNP